MRLDIKPLSVNQAWGGRTFKSSAYKKYIEDMMLILKPIDIPEGHLELTVTFGFSSKASDIDNPLKPFIDCLQQKYGFNDKNIKRLIINAEHVKRNEDFIDWHIKSLC